MDKKNISTANVLYTRAKIGQLMKAAHLRKYIIEQCEKAADNGEFEYYCSEYLMPADIEWLQSRGFAVQAISPKLFIIKWSEFNED